MPKYISLVSREEWKYTIGFCPLCRIEDTHPDQSMLVTSDSSAPTHAAATASCGQPSLAVSPASLAKTKRADSTWKWARTYRHATVRGHAADCKAMSHRTQQWFTEQTHSGF